MFDENKESYKQGKFIPHEIHEQSISCGFFFFFLHFTSKFMKVVVEMANEAYDDALES